MLAGGFIDHTGKVVDVTWTDGVTKAQVGVPLSRTASRCWRCSRSTDGKIAGVEAVFVTVPYNMPSAW